MKTQDQQLTDRINEIRKLQGYIDDQDKYIEDVERREMIAWTVTLIVVIIGGVLWMLS